MKKLFVICIGLSLPFFISGCSLGTIVREILPQTETAQEENAVPQARVYMDEVSGVLTDFNGSQLTLQTEDEGLTYTFDVSGATLECEEGMIAGDVISVIYEGRLGGTDTSTVRALKVVDELRNTEELTDQTANGTLQALTLNTITIQSKEGLVSKYTTTGAEQYFRNGIKIGSKVFLHLKGIAPAGESKMVSPDTSHMKVLSVSDKKNLKVPAPTEVPSQSEDGESSPKEKKLHVMIQNIQNQTLQVLPDNSDKSLNVDLSSIPVYFKGGISAGAYANVIYTGKFNGESLEGLTVLGVTGEDPDTIRQRNITSSISGTIVGVTTGTITLKTGDGAVITCDIQNAENSSTQGLSAGAVVRVTFDPSASVDSNIYYCLSIEDA